MTFYNSNIKILDIEPTSYCNAKCPQCMRETRNGDYSFFKQVHLSETFFEVYLPKTIAANLELATFSGNVGEPAMNKQLPAILKWFRQQNPNVFLEVFTNGGVQSTEWWHELGLIIGNNGNVIFALDGLEDTNHIYRIDVKWNKVIENARAFISSGARATWQFIPFEHNEHQIQLAEQMSIDMGFSEFKIKISHRELLNQPQNIKNKVNSPKNIQYKHQGAPLDFVRLDKTEEYLNSVNIKCYAIELGNLYISAEGKVFPCCHTASIPLLEDDMIPEPYSWIKNVKKDFDFDEISLYNNSLDEIINSNTFINMKGSWSKNMEQGRNPLCAAVCGKCDGSKSLIEGLLNNA